MRDHDLDALLFDEALSPARRDALRALLRDDPEAGAALRRWMTVQAALRRRLETDLPDRRLLVLFALERSGRGGALTADERADLDRARPSLTRFLSAHPGMEAAVDDVEAAAADFDAVWADHFEAASTPVPARADRPGVQRLHRAGRTPVLRWAGRAAAVLAVLAFAAVVALVWQRDAGLETIATAPDEVRVLTLADGSTVRLMGGSELTYTPPEASTPFNRRVRLVGRALFDVQHGTQPFVVETETALTTVLGTRFGVEADAEVTEVVLVTGKVALAPRAARAQMVVLAPGQASRVAAAALPTTPAEVDVAEALAWTDLFVFRATPLAEIAERLTAHYGVQVTAAPELADEAVTGTFDQADDLRDVLDAVAATLQATVRETSDGYVVEPRTS